MARKKTTEEEDRDTLEKIAGIGEMRANRKTEVTRPATVRSDTSATVRMNEDDVVVLERLRTRTGIQSLTCIIRLAIREACEARGIDAVRLVEEARFSRQVDANYGKEEKLCPALPSRVEVQRRSRRQHASKRA